jgi:hypothetical protein
MYKGCSGDVLLGCICPLLFMGLAQQYLCIASVGDVCLHELQVSHVLVTTLSNFAMTHHAPFF